MLRIAYLGPEKTNTHLAAQTRFGRRARYLHAPTVDDIFDFVERRKADYGVVPIENSLEGAVTHTLDRFIDFVDTPAKIHGEIEQPIRHFLILHRDTDLETIKNVFSHSQALAQCRQWLDKHVPQAARHETNSTAEAVEQLGQKLISGFPGSDELVLQHPRQSAAIGRKELVSQHKMLRSIRIPEERDNKTRFLIIGLGEPRKGSRNKTSILLALKDQPGALHDALMPFKRFGINLTKIESRPSKRKAWEYLFFIDFTGHESEARVKKALKALKRSTAFLRVLGSYPIHSKRS